MSSAEKFRRRPSGAIYHSVPAAEALLSREPGPDLLTDVDCSSFQGGHHAFYLKVRNSLTVDTTHWALLEVARQHLTVRAEDGGVETWRVHEAAFTTEALASDDPNDRQVQLAGDIARLGSFIFHPHRPGAPSHTDWTECIPL